MTFTSPLLNVFFCVFFIFSEHTQVTPGLPMLHNDIQCTPDIVATFIVAIRI